MNKTYGDVRIKGEITIGRAMQDRPKWVLWDREDRRICEQRHLEVGDDASEVRKEIYKSHSEMTDEMVFSYVRPRKCDGCGNWRMWSDSGLNRFCPFCGEEP